MAGSLQIWKERWMAMREEGFNWKFPPRVKELEALLLEPSLNWPFVNTNKGCCKTGEFIVIKNKSSVVSVGTMGEEWWPTIQLAYQAYLSMNAETMDSTDANDYESALGVLDRPIAPVKRAISDVSGVAGNVTGKLQKTDSYGDLAPSRAANDATQDSESDDAFENSEKVPGFTALKSPTRTAQQKRDKREDASPTHVRTVGGICGKRRLTTSERKKLTGPIVSRSEGAEAHSDGGDEKLVQVRVYVLRTSLEQLRATLVELKEILSEDERSALKADLFETQAKLTRLTDSTLFLRDISA